MTATKHQQVKFCRGQEVVKMTLLSIRHSECFRFALGHPWI